MKISIITFLLLGLITPTAFSQQLTPNQIYGQQSFTTNSVPSTPSTDTLTVPSDSFINSNGDTYICDLGSYRVLFYPAGSSTATRVYGQLGSFTTKERNKGGISADSLGTPQDVVEDASGRVYIVDFFNNRVLSYPPGGNTTADRVYGQLGSFTTNEKNKGGISARSLSNPTGIDIAVNGAVSICDNNNNRVLIYPHAVFSDIAFQVYGQLGSFTTNTVNKGGITKDSLGSPHTIITYSTGNIYISDTFNKRILGYTDGANPTSATIVIGQGGNFNTQSFYPAMPVNANMFDFPTAMALEMYNNKLTLYVCDRFYHRVLGFVDGSTTATIVYGQPNFTSTGANTPTLDSTSLNEPYGISVRNMTNGDVVMVIVDRLNNRAIGYSSNSGGTPIIPGGGSTNNVCFHHSTNINGYSYEQLKTGDHDLDCVVVHEVISVGIEIIASDVFGSMNFTLQLTPDHLVKTRKGFTAAGDLSVDDTIFIDVGKGVEDVQTIVIRQLNEKNIPDIYFGLNCLESIVAANTIITSTFGRYHHVPALWMKIVGHAFGIKKASQWGDAIVSLF
tara:strand:- start:90777 stop:92459 length:1683 start_codon:yes stop_codon:yes gene_type:complete